MVNRGWVPTLGTISYRTRVVEVSTCHNESLATYQAVLSEVAQKRPEMQCKVMGLDNEREREIDSILLACLQTRLRLRYFIAIRSINIHQYDFSYFLVPHIPSSLATGRTYLYRTSH